MAKPTSPIHAFCLSRRVLHRMVLGGMLSPLFIAEDASAGQKHALVGTENIADYLDIQRLVFRYAQAVDTLDAAAFADCFLADGVLQGRTVEGVEIKMHGDFSKKVMEGHSKLEQTMHLMLNHLHTIRGHNASGVTYGIAIWIIRKEGELITQEHYIRYNDELVKIDNRWFFATRTVDALYTTEGPVASFNSDLALSRKR